jgi:carbon starvation protein CstA
LQLPETIEPLEYKAQAASIRSPCITPKDIINHCLSLLGATTYGEIYNLHATVVDKNKENHARRTCQKLAIEMADMFSAASKFIYFLSLMRIIFFSLMIVDSGKTGYQIDRKRIQEIRKISGFVYPDFLMKKCSYQSQSILGILFRRAVDFKNQNQHLFEDQDTIVSINSSAKVSVIDHYGR